MAGSLLDLLAARRAELVEAQKILLPVPGWTSPTLHLRVQPVEHDVINRLLGRLEKTPDKQKSKAELAANAALIGVATVGVLIGGEGPELALSDDNLIKGLGLEDADSNAAVIRALVLRDGDIFSLSAAVMRHSGYANEIVEDELSGD